jgi:hypothetical protein
MVKKLLSEKTIKGISAVRPQTNEKCTCDISLNESNNGRIDITNVCGI